MNVLVQYRHRRGPGRFETLPDRRTFDSLQTQTRLLALAAELGDRFGPQTRSTKWSDHTPVRTKGMHRVR